MRKLFALLVLLPVSVVSTGCFPITTQMIPAMHGTVRDVSTGVPIGDAHILVELPKRTDISTTSISNLQGDFFVSEVSHRLWLMPGYDVFIQPPQMIISAAGYDTKTLDLYSYWQDHPNDLGVKIDLKHQ